MPEFYTLKEVAAHFRYKSVKTLYRWIDEGKHFDMSVIKKTSAGYLVPRYEVDRLSEAFDVEKTT